MYHVTQQADSQAQAIWLASIHFENFINSCPLSSYLNTQKLDIWGKKHIKAVGSQFEFYSTLVNNLGWYHLIFSNNDKKSTKVHKIIYTGHWILKKSLVVLAMHNIHINTEKI